VDFYDRVKQLAKENKGLSVQEFILSIGLNHDSYYSLRRAGNLPRANEALKIAQALGTSVEYLVSGLEPANSKAAVLNELQAFIDARR
jgi:transcriptional regulator with XRE-family HTH domain